MSIRLSASAPVGSAPVGAPSVGRRHMGAPLNGLPSGLGVCEDKAAVVPPPPEGWVRFLQSLDLNITTKPMDTEVLPSEKPEDLPRFRQGMDILSGLTNDWYKISLEHGASKTVYSLGEKLGLSASSCVWKMQTESPEEAQQAGLPAVLALKLFRLPSLTRSQQEADNVKHMNDVDARRPSPSAATDRIPAVTLQDKTGNPCIVMAVATGGNLPVPVMDGRAALIMLKAVLREVLFMRDEYNLISADTKCGDFLLMCGGEEAPKVCAADYGSYAKVNQLFCCTYPPPWLPWRSTPKEGQAVHEDMTKYGLLIMYLQFMGTECKNLLAENTSDEAGRDKAREYLTELGATDKKGVLSKLVTYCTPYGPHKGVQMVVPHTLDELSKQLNDLIG